MEGLLDSGPLPPLGPMRHECHHRLARVARFGNDEILPVGPRNVDLATESNADLLAVIDFTSLCFLHDVILDAQFSPIASNMNHVVNLGWGNRQSNSPP